MPENWKKDISKEFIKEKVLNKDLVEIQESLQSLKESIGMGDDSSNNGYFGVDNIMNIIFNNEGKIRGKIGFEACKLKSIVYMMISSEGKNNLDLLYNELEKANSESELRESLGIELSNLESEITGNEQGNKITDNESSNEGSQTDNIGSESVQGNTDTVNESKIESLSDNENYIYNQAKLYGITDNRQMAYILATVKGECDFGNKEERGKGEGKKYGKIDKSTGKSYYGRGFVQLTWKSNYEKFTKIIQKSGLNFKDNNGNIIVGNNIDLVKNPDLILQSNDLAAFILVYGMKNGSFTGKKLDNYINDKNCDFENARRIINGTDHSDKFAGHARNYLKKINKSEDNKNIDNNENIDNDLLIGPELLAKNRDEIGGLGNSIMYGIQGYGKSQFKNMDGAEGKNTKTHPDRFKSQQDVKNYVKNNPGVKSFIFYFGGNTSNNKKTLADIEKWSVWLKQEGIQPVLCTCIGVDTHVVKKTGEKWLKPLNKSIIDLGKQNNYPVINFASIDEKVEKGDDNIHPTGSGYQLLRDQIDKYLS